MVKSGFSQESRIRKHCHTPNYTTKAKPWQTLANTSLSEDTNNNKLALNFVSPILRKFRSEIVRF